MQDDRDLTNNATCDPGMNPGLETTDKHTNNNSQKKLEGRVLENGNVG